MADEKQEPKQFEKAPLPERGHIVETKESGTERQESAKSERMITEELMREIEMMDLDENLKKAAEQKANKIQFLADDDKLKNLLEIAKEKGVLVAVQAAKKMNDPFLLDTLHDLLAREGYYQKFIK